MNLTTTFKKLLEADACTSRYKFLREALTNVTNDEPINLLTILETNGLDDALWALRATEQDCEHIARLMAADFAEQAIQIWQKYFVTDNRPQLAIKAARDFAKGLITVEQMYAARDAALYAARDAAWAVVGSAVVAAARAAAGAAAAAEFAARDVAEFAGFAARAARDVAEFAVREKQREIFISYLKEESHD